MRLWDLIRLIFENLGRRKARVALTAIGVVIGTAAIVVLVSLAIGLQRSANEQLYGIGDLTQIQVYPGYEETGPLLGVQQRPGDPPPGMTPITNQSLRDFAALPNVAMVIPRDYLMSGGILRYNRMETYPNFLGVGGIENLADLGLTAQQGDLTLGRGKVVIGAMIPNNFYDTSLRPGQEPPPPPELVGQTLRLILIKYDKDGVEIRKNVTLKVVGWLTETRSESDWNIYVSIDELTAWNEWAMGRRINRDKEGYNQAVVKVNDAQKVLEVNDQIVEMGFQAYTPQSFVQGINSFYVVLQVVFGGVGAIALLVAAIGIANTMTMSVLERTREIGLMKALGATNRNVLSIFLGESAGIGLIGGLGGILFGWGAGQIINVLALAYLAGQAAQQGGPPPSSAVITPLWLLGFALFFATLIGLISGVYPALRAATMVPVTALKYE